MTISQCVVSGATLKGENAVVTWNPAEKEEEEYPERANKLILKQILLGVEAKADEYNVVEVSNLFTLTSKYVSEIPMYYNKIFMVIHRWKQKPKKKQSRFRSQY